MFLLRSRISIAAAVAAAGVLAAATFTFAAVTPGAHHRRSAAKKGPATLVVPNVEGKAYVFAEGMLEDAGFAWRVAGSVHGFAADTVVTQTPSGGVKVLDTGAPLIVLSLARNSHYAEVGTPVDAAPFVGTEVRLPGAVVRRASTVISTHRPAVSKPQSVTTSPAKTTPAPAKAPTAHTKAPASAAAKPKSNRSQHAVEALKPAVKRLASKRRPRAFIVRGAPKEPLDEMPLTSRAKLLAAWVGTHRKPTAANVHHWLFQHAWIVTGAQFGWWHGEQALQTLISIDRQVEREWKMGQRSETVARGALAEVRARTH